MVDEFDRAIGRIISTLEEQQMLENTLIWFFSDNGGLNPSAASDGMRSFVASLVSLFGRPLPTGIELPPAQVLDGAARWASINGADEPANTDFIAVSMDDRAVLRGQWKLIVSADGVELYNLAEDPFEQLDRAADNPVLVEELQSAIDDIPQRESINQSLFRIMMDMDRFGGEEDRPPWADVVRQVGD